MTYPKIVTRFAYPGGKNSIPLLEFQEEEKWDEDQEKMK
jgi:hypothetical protein